MSNAQNASQNPPLTARWSPAGWGADIGRARPRAGLVYGHEAPDSLEPRHPALHSPSKRVLDITVAGLLLVMLIPVLVLVALAIKLDSPGPALFRQRRGGAGGRVVTIYKFRTMRVQEDDKVVQARRGDDRITGLGALLRRTSVDELPQLMNVLQGRMSLVGPRPHALAHDQEFQATIPQYSRRFAVKPGITGLAQIRGYRGSTQTRQELQGRVDCDLEYIATWSLWADLKILTATIKVPLDRRAF